MVAPPARLARLRVGVSGDYRECSRTPPWRRVAVRGMKALGCSREASQGLAASRVSCAYRFPHWLHGCHNGRVFIDHRDGTLGDARYEQIGMVAECLTFGVGRVHSEVRFREAILVAVLMYAYHCVGV